VLTNKRQNVFCVIKYESYDGDELLGVYSTHEKATNRIVKELGPNKNSFIYEFSNEDNDLLSDVYDKWGDGYRVDEIILDSDKGRLS